jgi:hypothetical protein
MSEVKPRQWFQARLRWAVLEEGWGLYQWREADHIFLSEDRETAFQQALRMGYADEHTLVPAADQPPAPTIECRFAEVVYLEELGVSPTSIQVYLGERPVDERIGFDHQFDPAAREPGPIF